MTRCFPNFLIDLFLSRSVDSQKSSLLHKTPLQDGVFLFLELKTKMLYNIQQKYV